MAHACVQCGHLKHHPFAQKETAFVCFSPTAESFGVSAQIGSGVVWGSPEVRFHEGSRVARGFYEGCGVVRAQKENRMLLGISPELFFGGVGVTHV